MTRPGQQGLQRPAPQRDRARRVLAVASSGGHLKQLVSLLPRIPNVGEVTWLTYDRGSTRQLLVAAGRGHDRLVHTSYAAPRDVRNLLKNARVAARLVREHRYDLAVSTGAGIAVAALPVARARGVRSVFIESATRSDGPSLSGRILQRIPGVELYTQHREYPPGWRPVGSVHDGFARGHDRDVERIRRVVVTLGTIRPYGFRRLIERLVAVLPNNVEVLWQTGATDVTGLGIDAREVVPTDELRAAIAAADVVVAHAGTGTAVTAFELGRCPVLVPRRRREDEHVDDHQVTTAKALADRDLAVYAEVDQLDLPLLHEAAARSVVRREDVPALPL